MTAKSRSEITSAADKSIGFDYQFYYFFYLILDLRHGQKIGLENKDDIHIELPDDKIILLQTKHTVTKRSDGSSINLTELDLDLWKTINNWVLITNENKPINDFLKKVRFQLISNKNIGTNPFIVNLIKVQNKEITISQFKDYLRNLKKSTDSADTKKYISSLLSLKITLLRKFLNAISFDLAQDDLITKIKKRLLEKIHIKERVKDVYNALHSELRDKNYLTIKAKEKILISFEDFNKEFRQCFKSGLSNHLPIRTIPFTMPDNPANQNFIKQLIEIGDISVDDSDEIVEFTTYMLQLYNNLKMWQDDGDMLIGERDNFDKQSILIWKNSFRSKYRTIKSKIEKVAVAALEEDIKAIAIECLDDMRRQILKVDETLLSMELSNGHFYLLTEESKIGWHYEWKKKYKS